VGIAVNNQMDDTFQSMMREATRLTRSGRLTEATQIIQRAMSKAAPPAAQPGSAAASPFTEGDVLEGLVRVLSDDDVADLEPQPEAEAEAEAETETEAGPAAHAVGESFVTGVFSRDSQDHHYKLYSPPRQATNAPLPLVVMLHGCTQNPDDFALGTGMNEAARGGVNAPAFYVVYPSQPRSANAQGCWNWFERAHQKRGRGEPAWIAELTQHVVANHRIDAQRVYIAGLSAGGAMAALVASVYPDLFAAVGVHSGLPTGAASNLTEALTAMKHGTAANEAQRSKAKEANGPDGAAGARWPGRPTIVFHGDRDRTVHAANAQALVDAAALDANGDVPVRTQTQAGESAFGKKFTRSVYANPARIQAEHWLLHGAGHAWSGGAATGSYTDPRGVSATREMLRFFWMHRLGDV